MKNKRVVHITTVHNVLDTRIFYKECKSAAKYSEVYLIAPTKENFISNDVKIINLPQFKNRFIRLVVTNFIAFKKATNLKADVYHFHDPEFIPWAILLKKFTNAKVIYDVHEDYFTSIKGKKWINNSIVRNFLAYAFNNLEKRAAKVFDALILAEDYYIEKFNGINKKTVEILNYPIIYENKEKINIPKNKFLLVYSGTVSENRGIWNLLGLAYFLRKKRDDFEIYIIGKVSSDLLLENINKNLNLNRLLDTVKIVGGKEYVKREVIDAYHREMDIGLVLIPFSTHYERKLPTKFFEYMLAGLPIIATNFPRWRDFLDENECGFAVNPDDFEEIAKYIEYLIENPTLRIKMGENGKLNVLKKYNWEMEEKKLKKLYEELLNT